MTGWTDKHSSVPTARSRFPLELVHRAARLYYLEEVTQADIASILSVSRATVSRLVSEARRIGLVEIRVNDPFEEDAASLAEQVRAALRLDHVQVVSVAHESTLGQDVRTAVATAVGRMDLGPGKALLIGNGRATHAIANDGMPSLPGVYIVPTVGGQADPLPWFQTNEITRIAAARAGGIPLFLYAQALPSAAMRASLEDDPTFRQVVDFWQRASGALVGVGAPPATRDALASGVPVDDDLVQHAAGDVSLNFYDAAGAPIEFAGSDRMVRTPRHVLAAIPHVVAVAVGAQKAPSIIAAVRGGLIDELITDATTARAVLTAAQGSTPANDNSDAA